MSNREESCQAWENSEILELAIAVGVVSSTMLFGIITGRRLGEKIVASVDDLTTSVNALTVATNAATAALAAGGAGGIAPAQLDPIKVGIDNATSALNAALGAAPVPTPFPVPAPGPGVAPGVAAAAARAAAANAAAFNAAQFVQNPPQFVQNPPHVGGVNTFQTPLTKG